MEPQNTLNSQSTLEKKNKARGIMTSDYTTVIKTVWYCHKNRHIDLRNRIESPEINPHMYAQLLYHKECKNIHCGKDSRFNKWCWENWTVTCKRVKLEHFITPYTKINSKVIRDLNLRPETIKLPEENIGSTLFDVSLSNIFLDLCPQAGEMKGWNHGT